MNLELDGLSSVLELCCEERLFRNGSIYKKGAIIVYLMELEMEEHDQEGRVITL